MNNGQGAVTSFYTLINHRLYRSCKGPKPLLNLTRIECLSKNNLQVEPSKAINDILQIRLKYCLSHIAYILCSAHSKRARPQNNAPNIIYFKTPSLHKLQFCFARSLQARSLRSNYSVLIC